MGKKAILGSLIAGAGGYLVAEIIGDPIALSVFSYNPASAQILDTTIKAALTIGSALGVYKGLREREKYEELGKRVEAAEVLEEIHHPLVIEQKEDEYKIGDTSGKSEEEALSKYFMKLTGGKSHITPIPGRGSFVMSDFLRGKYEQWQSYLSENPGVKDEPPEIQNAIFEREILGKKVNIETVRKSVAKLKH